MHRCMQVALKVPGDVPWTWCSPCAVPGRNRGSGYNSRVKTTETRQPDSCSGSVGRRLRVGSEDPHVALGARVPPWPETVALGTHGGSLQPRSLVERSCGLVLVGLAFTHWVFS